MDQEETLARAMCRADDRDPDEPVPDGGRERPDAAPDRPRWTLYAPRARQIIASFERLGHDG